MTAFPKYCVRCGAKLEEHNHLIVTDEDNYYTGDTHHVDCGVCHAQFAVIAGYCGFADCPDCEEHFSVCPGSPRYDDTHWDCPQCGEPAPMTEEQLGWPE
jgi:predicted RNA-binding Zn-ribbon protein involved in translation (DUF1610 family)